MALDKVNDRLFIGHHGNSRYDIYQLNHRGLPLRRHADFAVGRSLIGRGFAFAPLGKKYLNFPSGASFDPKFQRLFVPDNSSLGPPGFRIMVFDVHPEKLKKLRRGELIEAIAVLGQPNFDTWAPGSGPNKIGGRGVALVDSDRQLLFFSDGSNHRILVWDIHPEKLKNGMDAIAVIGQLDFNSVEPGVGRNRLAGPRALTYDPVREHLFVGDSRNNRILVFDVSGKIPRTGLGAIAVIGQADFNSRIPRTDLRKIKPETLGLDYKNHRLFEGEQFNNRLLVFDVNPDKLHGALNPDAIAVVGQPDFTTTDPAVTQTRLTMPRITIDSERQLAYAPDGYPSGNRINIFDIRPDHLKKSLMPMLDQIGHINAEGKPDFTSRSANDRTSPRYWTQGRDISIDTVDHRLFLSDNYGHRILIFQLDRMNRILDRSAKWALGQKDTSTSVILPGRDATVIKLPLAVEYDDSHKRLFVADTWNDRVLVFDMTPGHVRSGMPASYVLGQPDFTTYAPKAARNRIYFGSREGRGIYTTESRAGELAMDRKNQRLFVTDGGNHRVLVFDVDPSRIHNGADALAVLGQKDFNSREHGLSANRWELPGDLVLDEKNQRLFVGVAWQHRVLVFDVRPDRIQNGMNASLVIGQRDFTGAVPGLTRSQFRQTDGLSYDSANDHLYVTDKYNHRVLVFDVRPEVLTNFPEAIAVLGEKTFDKVEMGPGDPRNFPDRLYDPRGSYFDSKGQRLFQSEGLNGRLTVFTLPRQAYRVDLPARSSLTYQSLDSHTSRGAEDFSVGHAQVELNEPTEILGFSSHLQTRVVMDDQSERRSRLLISEADLPAPGKHRSVQLFFDNRQGTRLALSVVNSNSETTAVRFKLIDQRGRTRKAQRELAPGSQLSVQADQLFGGANAGTVGVLWVEGDDPLTVAGLLQTRNGHGEVLSIPAPIAVPEPLDPGSEQAAWLQKRRVLSKITTGAGQRILYVLMNPTDEPMEGTLEIEGRSSAYQIEPRGVFSRDIDGDTRPLLTTYGIVRASKGPAPASSALVYTQRRDGSLQTARIVTAHQEGTLFWAPINTYPTLLRHGDQDAQLTLVNEGRVPATVYLELFDLDGKSTGRVEKIVPLAKQVIVSLEDIFGRSPLRGTLRIFSDSPVAASLEKQVINIAGELILSDIPLQETPVRATRSLLFPVFSNGSGSSTEMQMINTGTTAVDGHLGITTTDGKAVTIILR